MKKFLLMLIIVVLSIGFVGCGSNNSSTEISNNTEKSNKNDSLSNQSSQSENNENSNSIQNKAEAKEHKVGDTIAIDGEELTVTEVKRDYKSGNEYIKPDSGNEYVKITVTIKNSSDDTISVSPYEFKILDGNGVYRACNYILKQTLASTQLAKGGNISGSMTFEVPKNDANLKLIYTPSFWSDDYVEIKL